MYVKYNIKDLFYFFAKKLNRDSSIYPYKISLQYKNINNPTFIYDKYKDQFNKIQGLITDVVIKPNQIFSFWKIIRNPYLLSKDQEFISQLTIISGIIYHLSLIGGLSIVERHHDNFDYFINDNQIHPLGADADIIYKSKDLRIKNIFSFPLKLELKITDQFIEAYILSTQKISANEVHFHCRNYKSYTEVLTRVNKRTVEVSVYKKRTKE